MAQVNVTQEVYTQNFSRDLKDIVKIIIFNNPNPDVIFKLDNKKSTIGDHLTLECFGFEFNCALEFENVTEVTLQIWRKTC